MHIIQDAKSHCAQASFPIFLTFFFLLVIFDVYPNELQSKLKFIVIWVWRKTQEKSFRCFLDSKHDINYYLFEYTQR